MSRVDMELGKELVRDVTLSRHAVGNIGSIGMREIYMRTNNLYEERFEGYVAEGRVAVGGLNRLRSVIGLPPQAPAITELEINQFVADLMHHDTLVNIVDNEPLGLQTEPTYTFSTAQL